MALEVEATATLKAVVEAEAITQRWGETTGDIDKRNTVTEFSMVHIKEGETRKEAELPDKDEAGNPSSSSTGATQTE